MRGLDVLEQTYLRIFRLYPFMVPLAVVMACGETGYAGVNNFGLPLYVRGAAVRLGVDAASVGKTVGLIISAFLLTETLLRIPLGMLSDSVGRKTLIVAGPLLGCGAMILTARVGHWQWMIPIRAFDGAAAAALWPSIFALIGDRVARDDRATAMSVTNMVYMAGIALGPALGGVLIRETGAAFAPFLMAAGVFLFAAMIAFAFLPGGTAVQREEEGGAEVRVSRLSLAAMLLLAFAQTFGVILLGPVLPLYARDRLHLSPLFIGILPAMAAVPAGLLAMPLGRLADRVGRDVAVKVGLTVAGIGMWLVPFARSFVELSIVMIALALAYAFALPAWLAMVTEVSPRQGRGQTIGKFGTAQGLGAVLAPVAGGFLFDSSPRLPFFASAALLTVSALLACATLPRTAAADKSAR